MFCSFLFAPSSAFYRVRDCRKLTPAGLSKSITELPPPKDKFNLLNTVCGLHSFQYPGIDFLFFVEVLAELGRSQLKKIIALVFQSKLSAEDSTTRFGRAGIDDAYNVAKHTME